MAISCSSWHGSTSEESRALRSLQRPQEARAAFEKAIEAVRTAPKFRRAELGPWEKQARQELKA